MLRCYANPPAKETMRKPKQHPRAGTIPSAEIVLAYKEAFGMSWWQSLLSLFNGTFKMADAYYQEADHDSILTVLEADRADTIKYIREDFDCDDFAFMLMGAFHNDERTAAMPIFITWVEWYTDEQRYGHAVLSYYCKGIVNIIEPQNDNVFLVPDDWSLTVLMG